MNPDIPREPFDGKKNRFGACTDEEYQLTFFLQEPLASRGPDKPGEPALSGEHVLSLPRPS